MEGLNKVSLTPGDLASLASAAYGPRWQSPFARDFCVPLRTVQRWARDGIGKPSTANAARSFLIERARLRIEPPPPIGEEERDDHAYDEMRPHIEALVRVGGAAGWHAAEVLAAILAVTVDLMSEGAGEEATARTLDDVLAALRRGT
ncbi:hypothetical protein [Ancylobacter polymorphus]|uniref:Uncharacterized protein n=1 Tax=Ancylobacter polymorphus TaxID=223390 RepID=A0A9E6ZWH8_9HYPH|nr:hypothetical protein [Ancylobacter polymorphus]UOK73031.1 hypothetical protein K9D25_10180 [Ancylobacter polymorphus]